MLRERGYYLAELLFNALPLAQQNAQSSVSGLLGPNWSLDAGNDVYLSFNNGNVTFHGPGGFSAPYTADSNSYGGYAEPPGIDATLYSYNAAEELTRTVQGSTPVTYSYDGNGNLTSSTDGNSYSYNKKNQTTAIDGNSYSYSGPDQTERVTLNSTSDAYSGLGLSYETTSGNATYYTRCSCGMLINERLPNSGGKYYSLFDGQGSVVGLTDSNGNEVNDYDPYGVILNTATNPVANPFQYEAGYFESSTGLVKFGTR